MMTISALHIFLDTKAITKGEELCISYGGNLWFDDADGDGNSSFSDDTAMGHDGMPEFLNRSQF